METFYVVKFKLYPKNPIGFETENIGGLTIEEITNYIEQNDCHKFNFILESINDDTLKYDID